jgi:hypothetical protein
MQVTKRLLNNLIKRFAEANVGVSWRGNRDVADRDAIDAEYDDAKASLEEALDELFSAKEKDHATPTIETASPQDRAAESVARERPAEAVHA